MKDLNVTSGPVSSVIPALPAVVSKQLIARLFALLLISFSCVPSAFAAPESVNINNADAVTIAEVLDGVGMSRAQAIVEYRQQNGAFTDLYDLSNVKGIGDRTIEINESRIKLTD